MSAFKCVYATPLAEPKSANACPERSLMSAALSVVEGLKVESCKLGDSGKMKFRFSLMIYFGAAKIGGFSFSR
ncbi:MAG: hypothetical protein BWY67_00757 [Bacteroidetes bacterium ADurb.Bin397]|nr:MAG: hypothetical protein BWY67_00757 [Bacteroidetes bacterium ADurb.Bin397]